MEKQGKINPEFVRQVAPDLLDLEVYLIEERKQHILEHHPEAEDLLVLLPELVERPDFTQRDPRSYTVRFYKFYCELPVGGGTVYDKYLMCPVRLNADLPPGYKNSIITLYLLRKPMEGDIIWQAS
jgi:hypothetical protein